MGIIEEIYEALVLEISPKTEDMKAVLHTKVENAYKEVVLRRSYPEDMDDESIEKDMNRYYSVVNRVALVDYNWIGAEGQGVIQENGEYRSFNDREKLFAGVIPFASII